MVSSLHPFRCCVQAIILVLLVSIYYVVSFPCLSSWVADTHINVYQKNVVVFSKFSEVSVVNVMLFFVSSPKYIKVKFNSTFAKYSSCREY